MLELISGLPNNVIGCSAKGVLTATDYQDVLIPAIERALAHHRRIRCYYELGAAFIDVDPSVLWDEFKVEAEHVNHWERIAIVTDVAWIAHTVNALRFLITSPTRVFAMTDRSEARSWIRAPA